MLRGQAQAVFAGNFVLDNGEDDITLELDTFVGTRKDRYCRVNGSPWQAGHAACYGKKGSAPWPI